MTMRRGGQRDASIRFDRMLTTTIGQRDSRGEQAFRVQPLGCCLHNGAMRQAKAWTLSTCSRRAVYFRETSNGHSDRLTQRGYSIEIRSNVYVSRPRLTSKVELVSFLSIRHLSLIVNRFVLSAFYSFSVESL